MLKELRIKNFAIIDELTIDFTDGLNLLTGETGSGKSIIIEALEMVLGGRGSKDIIKTGKEKALIEAMFFLDEDQKSKLNNLGYDCEDILIVSKEISDKYPSVSRINNRPITLSALSQITSSMVDIFGQHEHQSLLDIKNHMEIVDSLLDKPGKEKLSNIGSKYEEFKNLNRHLEEISISSYERERELDILQFQINEIDSANLNDSDEEEIELEFKKYDNLKDILKNTREVGAIIKENYEGTSLLSQLDYIMARINEVKKFDLNLQDTYQKLVDIRYQIDDLYRELDHYNGSLELDDERLFYLRERLDLVNTLKKKYGKTLSDINKYREEIGLRYDKLENLDKEMDLTRKKIEAIRETIYRESIDLSLLRKEVSIILEEKMAKELASLNMTNVVFKVDFKNKDRISGSGIDIVEFLISTNPGEELKPLSKIVSGGEMSRIMLAFKGIIADKDKTPTLIFDEIDTGISGRTAQIVGEKIKKIAKSHQVISISHLPQIAALADTHFLIVKDSTKNSTITKVERLSDDERIEELARLLGGVDVTQTTRDHAKEMLKMSSRIQN